ncbi:MAG: YjbQ family protein [Eubacteriaceae bacterium]|nr:YjbQ family protein [Eubacteriaceae bacterium]
MKKLDISFTKKDNLVDITDIVKAYVAESRLKNGMLCLYAPDTTVGLTMIDVDNKKAEYDFMHRWGHIMPRYDGMQWTGPATSGLKASAVGKTLQVMVAGGEMLLGLHQGVVAIDFEGPSERALFAEVYGDMLEEGETAQAPAMFTDYVAMLRQNEIDEEEETRRIVEEMRREYREQHPEMFPEDHPETQTKTEEKNGSDQ